MSKSEILTITVLFHIGDYNTFKHFHLHYVQKHLYSEFPETVYYNCFVELMQSNIFTLSTYLKFCCMGECTGISFIDFTPIKACKKTRIKNITTVGKSKMGWFYGFITTYSC